MFREELNRGGGLGCHLEAPLRVTCEAPADQASLPFRPHLTLEPCFPVLHHSERHLPDTTVCVCTPSLADQERRESGR